MLLIAVYFVLNALAAECSEAHRATCGNGKCEKIGDTEICTECGANGNVPINGICKAHGSEETGAAGCKNGSDLSPSDVKVCIKCVSTNYFLFKGGCYKVDEVPGNTICQTAGAAGTCDVCKDGYFKNPVESLDNTKQSCIACNDTEGADYNIGVLNCAMCVAPETPGTSGGDKKSATCKSCLEGYYAENPLTCTQCEDNNCAICLGAGTGKCTKCKSGPGTGKEYLKITDIPGKSGECVEASKCTGTHFPATDSGNNKVCVLCSDVDNNGVAGCNTCTSTPISDSSNMVTVKCTECTTPKTNKPNVAGTGCFTCSIDGCDNCSENGVCEKCGNAKKVSPGKNSCVEQCPENSIEKESVCVCNSGYGPDSAGTGCVTVSTNLSTGAIASISVAAIVVVGGLVGFLCWWFICRGKA
ncbi:VSP [Giardia lamblia P15]|uniref:VSP n=1 Tax=Giardia intestinalis (strain P15) TaxID=658858 RepID=E1F9Q7_GIAIA|nr:VSP [Giardia lamblia P15]